MKTAIYMYPSSSMAPIVAVCWALLGTYRSGCYVYTQVPMLHTMHIEHTNQFYTKITQTRKKNIFEKMGGYVGFLPPPTYCRNTLLGLLHAIVNDHSVYVGSMWVGVRILHIHPFFRKCFYSCTISITSFGYHLHDKTKQRLMQQRGVASRQNLLWRGESTNTWLWLGPTNTWLCLDLYAGCYGAYSGRHWWRGNTKVADHQSPLLSVVLLVDHVITASLTSMEVWSIPLYSHETR